jgi:predicted MFS family arabinose efflux permease
VAGAAGGGGFAAAYALAGLCRCASVGLLAASREGRFSGLPNRARVARFLRTGRGSGAWRLVLLVGALQVALYVAAPYFNPYMLEELEFSYLEYMIASAWLVAVKVVVLPLWGRSIDRHGARRILVQGVVALALVPVPWVFVRELWGVLLCYSFSGATWSGFEVGHFSLLLEVGYRRMRPTIFAAQSVVAGAAQLAGSLLGAGVLAATLDMRTVFGVSAGLRLGAALLAIRFLPKSAAAGRRPPFRVAGFRPGTGMAQRPVEEARLEPPSGDSEEAGQEARLRRENAGPMT